MIGVFQGDLQRQGIRLYSRRQHVHVARLGPTDRQVYEMDGLLVSPVV